MHQDERESGLLTRPESMWGEWADTQWASPAWFHAVDWPARGVRKVSHWLRSLGRGNDWWWQKSSKGSSLSQGASDLLHSSVVCYVNKSQGASCGHGINLRSFLQVRGEQQALHDSVLRWGSEGCGEGGPRWLHEPGDVRLSLGHLVRLWLRCVQRHRGGRQRWREGGRRRWQEGGRHKRARGQHLRHHDGAQD